MAKEKAPAPAVGKKKAGDEQEGGVLKSVQDTLSKFRPKRRVGVYGIFFVFCISILGLYDTCNLKKKEDCGYSGISPLECRTVACFTKGGGTMQKLKITINRTKGTKLGLKFEDAEKKKSRFVVESITDGAVKEHNRASDTPLLLQDVIASVDGSSEIAKALKKTDSQKVVLDIRRSKLPSFLRKLIHRSGKPGRIETVLTAPNFVSWLETSSRIAGAGTLFWFLSGYPLASLPLYYWGLSGAVGWHLNKCCHDSNVAGGVPHCYKGANPTLSGATGKVWNYTSAISSKIYAKPKSYAKWLFVPPKVSF